MAEHPELVCAYHLTGDGHGEPIDWSAVIAWTPDRGQVWIHLDAAHPETAAWLANGAGLSPFVVDGLLATETRPRCDWFEDGTLLILRGVNLNPGAKPEDMVSIRAGSRGPG